MRSLISGFFGQIGLLSLLKPGMSLIFGSITCIVQLNGCAIRFSPSVTRVVYSDASGTGCGGYVLELAPEVSHGQWSVDQATCTQGSHCQMAV